MHMRVLLSRSRAYTTCPSCNGGRFQPEALNYKLEGRAKPVLSEVEGSRPTNSPPTSGGQNGRPTTPQSDATVPVATQLIRRLEACATLTLPEFDALSISATLDFLAKIDVAPNDSTAAMLRTEVCARL